MFFKIVNGKDILFLDNEEVRNDEIVNIFGSDAKLLILTKKQRYFLTMRIRFFKKWDAQVNYRLTGLSVYDAIQLKNKDYVLGTIANGLLCFSKEGNIIFNINQKNGLLNNTVFICFLKMLIIIFG